MQEIFPAVFQHDDRIFTKSIAQGIRVYGERLLPIGKDEYREWDPFRSKLGAAIKRGLQVMPIRPGSKVLYLGAAQGTTPSHVSDIVGSDGLVVCVEFSAKTFEKLLPLCEQRPNMIPVLADANQPHEYKEYCDGIDVVYQDVAQPNQADILVKNADAFLHSGGYGMLAVKARSVDVTMNPQDVFRQEAAVLKRSLEIMETVFLKPFEKDHAMIVCRKA